LHISSRLRASGRAIATSCFLRRCFSKLDLFLRREYKGQITVGHQASGFRHQAGPSQRAVFYVCDFYRFVQRNIFVPRATNFYTQPATERPARYVVQWKISRVGNKAEFRGHTSERKKKVFHRYAYNLSEMIFLLARRFVEFVVLRVLVLGFVPLFFLLR
jgi:hypothetical protein